MEAWVVVLRVSHLQQALCRRKREATSSKYRGIFSTSEVCNDWMVCSLWQRACFGLTEPTAIKWKTPLCCRAGQNGSSNVLYAHHVADHLDQGRRDQGTWGWTNE